MNIALVLIHLVACTVLVLVVLLQTGKGASLGAAFGGASQTVFGSSGAQTFLGKLTTLMAIVFMVTSLTLAIVSGGKGGSSVMTTVQETPAATTDSAAPAEKPAATTDSAAPAEKPTAAPAAPEAKPAAPAPTAPEKGK